MKLTVCLGSSCHVRGSHQVLETIQRLIQENNLEDKITLAASLCTGNCEKGVCVTIDGTLFTFTPETTEELFRREVLAKLN